MPPTLGSLLRACRMSAKLSRTDLAACIYRRNSFPAPSHITEAQILTAIIDLEQNNRCILAGEELLTFWRNALECLKKADTVTRYLLGIRLARELPDP